MFAKIIPITWYGSKDRRINNIEELFKTNKHMMQIKYILLYQKEVDIIFMKY